VIVDKHTILVNVKQRKLAIC